MKKIKIAAINSKALPLQIAGNLRTIQSHLMHLLEEDVDYALFPELSVSGYLNSPQQIEEYAAMHAGTLLELKQLSGVYKLTFSVGLPMPIGDCFAIGQVTFFQGDIIHTHYKTHLSVHERAQFISGQELTNFRVDDWNMGMQLCLESHYPELSLQQQRSGAEILCFAMASPRETAQEKFDRFLPMFKTRAYDNACFVMSCNLGAVSSKGTPYAQVAMILSPRGELLAQAIGETYCIAEIDYAQIAKIKNSVMSDFPAYRQTLTQSLFISSEEHKDTKKKEFYEVQGVSQKDEKND